MDDISETRLAEVHPQLASKIRQLADSLAGQGISIRVTQGLRTWDEQAALYAQGRTAPGSIVTNAPPGHSWHNFGLAVDVVPFDDSGQPDWNEAHPAWSLLETLGTDLGMMSGANFVHLRDAPHFQLTGRFPVSPDDEVRQIFQDGGIAAVWDAAQLS